VRTLAPNQTFDPARGSFLVRPRMVRENGTGDRFFIAPTEPNKSGEGYETFSNAIEFKPISHR